MLSKEELRPGNLVINVATLSEVIEIREDKVAIRNHDITGKEHIVNAYYAGLNGVPLDSAWTERFNAAPEIHQTTEGMEYVQQENVWKNKITGKTVTFVHELQNLYQDLTGKMAVFAV